MTAVLTIARLTVAEAGRRRTVWVLLGLTLLTVALTTWGVRLNTPRSSASMDRTKAMKPTQNQMLVAIM